MKPWVHRPIAGCRICRGTRLETVLNLGELHISCFPLPGEGDSARSPLHVVRCGECGCVQLRDTTNPDLLFGTYWYRSGTNRTMTDALRAIARSIESRVDLRPGDLVVDIGSNDNTLLKSYSRSDLVRVGFEPSVNISREARAADPSIRVLGEKFHRDPDFTGRARVITSIAMFYAVDDPHEFVKDAREMLAADGLWVMQLAYLCSKLERTAFDGICHEHLAYYSLQSLERLLGEHGLHVSDAELVDLNEGSIRLYIRHGEGPPSTALQNLRVAEKWIGLETMAPFRAFAERIENVKIRTTGFLRAAAAAGRVIHGYGASTKGNTLLQYFGLDRSLVTAIWERQPQKRGRETVGTRIPIISEEEGRSRKPDYLLMIPWHFSKEFIEREKAYLEAGGKFIIPLPEFRVVGA